jgi:hypothetical protein
MRFGVVWGCPGAVPGVLASACFGGGLSHRFNQLVGVHRCGDDRRAGDEPEQSRETT